MRRRALSLRSEYEKPRHALHDAGLIISFDLRPAAPGSHTRLSTSLHFINVQSGLANR